MRHGIPTRCVATVTALYICGIGQFEHAHKNRPQSLVDKLHSILHNCATGGTAGPVPCPGVYTGPKCRPEARIGLQARCGPFWVSRPIVSPNQGHGELSAAAAMALTG